MLRASLCSASAARTYFQAWITANSSYLKPFSTPLRLVAASSSELFTTAAASARARPAAHQGGNPVHVDGSAEAHVAISNSHKPGSNTGAAAVITTATASKRCQPAYGSTAAITSARSSQLASSPAADAAGSPGLGVPEAARAAAASGAADASNVPPELQRRLTAAVVGFPNAGKSELVNKLVGVKFSGVSPKRNTTLQPHLGSFTVGDTQVVLYDTPGLVSRTHDAHGPAHMERVRSSWALAAQCDLLLYVVDAEAEFRFRERACAELAAQLMVGPLPPVVRPWPRPPVALILNKADKLETGLRATVLEAVERGLVAAAAGAKAGPCSSGAGKSGAGGSSADAAAGMGVQKAVPGGAAVAGGQRDAFKGGRFARVLRTSALLGQGIGDVRQLLLHKAKPGPWLLPPGSSHDKTPGELALELVREKLYRRLNREMPYTLRFSIASDSPTRLPGGAEGSPRQRTRGDGAAALVGVQHGPCVQARHFEGEQASHEGGGGDQGTPGGIVTGEACASGSVHAGPSSDGDVWCLQAPQRAAVVPMLMGRRVVIHVYVASQKARAVVVGKGGAVIKQYVALPAQEELEKLLGVPVLLQVYVLAGKSPPLGAQP